VEAETIRTNVLGTPKTFHIPKIVIGECLLLWMVPLVGSLRRRSGADAGIYYPHSSGSHLRSVPYIYYLGSNF
jgi:hypothetical protein